MQTEKKVGDDVSERSVMTIRAIQLHARDSLCALPPVHYHITRIVLTSPPAARRSILIAARQECIFIATHLRMTLAGRRNVFGDIFNGLLLTNCTVRRDG